MRQTLKRHNNIKPGDYVTNARAIWDDHKTPTDAFIVEFTDVMLVVAAVDLNDPTSPLRRDLFVLHTASMRTGWVFSDYVVKVRT